MTRHEKPGGGVKQAADLYTGDMLEAPKRGRPRKPDALTPAERARRYRASKRAAKDEASEAAIPHSLAPDALGFPVFDRLPIALQWALRSAGVSSDETLADSYYPDLVEKVGLSTAQAKDLVLRARAGWTATAPAWPTMGKRIP